VAVGAPSAAAYGCSLGLDASKIGAVTAEGGAPANEDAPSSDDVAVSRPVDSGAPDTAPASDSGRCAVNADCTSANSCLTGTCDAGTCSFAVCPTSACQGSSCTAGACSIPASYGFHATQVTVSTGALGCGGNAQACLAAAYPFVFVGTTNGVVAYAVNDPSNPSPPVVPIKGLPFVPSFLASMGSRVYFVGAIQGSGTSYPIASLDVPTNPLVPSLQASAVLQVASVAGISAAWAGTDGSLFLVYNDGTGAFPSANVAEPLAAGPVTFYSSPGIPAGAAPVAASGARFLVARWQGAMTPYQTLFSFENAAGTLAAASSAEQDGGEQPSFAAIGPTTPLSTYAQGADGSDLWGSETAVIDDAGALTVSAVRLAWLVASGTAAAVTPAPFVDVEQYSPSVPYSSPSLAGPVAWVDSTTALVLATAHEYAGMANPQTSVQIATTSPQLALEGGLRSLITQPIGQVGAASSGGFGYVLAAGGVGATSCTLHVFAPSCPVQ
jgi:hypothetical protein